MTETQHGIFHMLDRWGDAEKERDEARAEVERLRAQIAVLTPDAELGRRTRERRERQRVATDEWLKTREREQAERDARVAAGRARKDALGIATTILADRVPHINTLTNPNHYPRTVPAGTLHAVLLASPTVKPPAADFYLGKVEEALAELEAAAVAGTWESSLARSKNPEKRRAWETHLAALREAH